MCGRMTTSILTGVAAAAAALGIAMAPAIAQDKTFD